MYDYLSTQTKHLLIELIEHAEKDEHVSFKFIRTWQDYLTLRTSRKVIKSIIKSLMTAQKNLFRRYCKDISAGHPEFNRLLACDTLKSTISFYREEHMTIVNMLDEYETYLLSGNLSDVFLLEQRPEDKLWDYRGI